MTYYPKWMPEAEERLRQLVSQGLTRGQIAQVMGLSRATVKSKLDRWGARTTLDHRRWWTEDLVARLRGMVDEGLSCGDVALALDLPSRVVSSKANKMALRFAVRTKSPRVSNWDGALGRRLEELVREGLGPSEIARRLGVTKNAVVGRMHRDNASATRGSRRFEAMVEKLAAAHVRRQTIEFPPSHRCQWPEGDPGEPGFSFCAAAAESTGPYCPEHHRVAWRRAGV